MPLNKVCNYLVMIGLQRVIEEEEDLDDADMSEESDFSKDEDLNELSEEDEMNDEFQEQDDSDENDDDLEMGEPQPNGKIKISLKRGDGQLRSGKQDQSLDVNKMTRRQRMAYEQK